MDREGECQWLKMIESGVTPEYFVTNDARVVRAFIQSSLHLNLIHGTYSIVEFGRRKTSKANQASCFALLTPPPSFFLFSSC